MEWKAVFEQAGACGEERKDEPKASAGEATPGLTVMKNASLQGWKSCKCPSNAPWGVGGAWLGLELFEP